MLYQCTPHRAESIHHTPVQKKKGREEQKDLGFAGEKAIRRFWKARKAVVLSCEMEREHATRVCVAEVAHEQLMPAAEQQKPQEQSLASRAAAEQMEAAEHGAEQELRLLKRRAGVAEETLRIKRERLDDAEKEYEEEHRTFTVFSKQLEQKWEQRYDALARLVRDAGVPDEDIEAVRKQPLRDAAATSARAKTAAEQRAAEVTPAAAHQVAAAEQEEVTERTAAANRGVEAVRMKTAQATAEQDAASERNTAAQQTRTATSKSRGISARQRARKLSLSDGPGIALADCPIGSNVHSCRALASVEAGTVALSRGGP